MLLRVSVFILFISTIVLAAEPLKMGVFPYTNPQKIATDYSSIAEAIGKVTGREVIVLSAKDYDDYMEKAKRLRYDIYVPCVSCIVKLIEDKVPLEVIAMGYPPFKGGVLVRSDSKIGDLKDIKGKVIGAVGKHTFAGYTFLKLKLKSLGIDIDKDNNVVFLGSTDNVVLSVLNGKVDVGITRTDILNDDRYKSAMKNIRIIYESIEIPSLPFAVSTNMEVKLKDQIKNALLNFTPPSDCKLGYKKIVSATNNDYIEFMKRITVK
ncbi:MAG: phosphate/phosphite/phosphonate ABC transporter substrate-binding protein [Deferribacterales bacterium]